MYIPRHECWTGGPICYKERVGGKVKLEKITGQGKRVVVTNFQKINTHGYSWFCGFHRLFASSKRRKRGRDTGFKYIEVEVGKGTSGTKNDKDGWETCRDFEKQSISKCIKRLSLMKKRTTPRLAISRR